MFIPFKLNKINVYFIQIKYIFITYIEKNLGELLSGLLIEPNKANTLGIIFGIASWMKNFFREPLKTRDGIQHTKKRTHHTKKELTTQYYFLNFWKNS
jgi:hypothetical protein